MGWAIGSSLKSVLDVDVSKSGVQWSKRLQVRVCIYVTKRLVRGKKITIEGGESKWVIFKYERLPIFCYRFGLLHHALKEYTEGQENSKLDGVNHLQYGAWPKGELIRQGGKELNKLETQGDKMGNPRIAEAKTAKSPERAHRLREQSGVDGNHVHKAINLVDSNPTREVVGIDPSTPTTEVLPENGKHQTLVGKVGKTEATLGVFGGK